MLRASTAERPVWRPSGPAAFDVASSDQQQQRPKSAPGTRKLKASDGTAGAGLVFEEWVHRKDAFDRGAELLGKLDSSRWENEERYEQLTAALVAIDEQLGVDADAEVRKAGGSGPAKTMYEVWKRNSMTSHALRDVPLSKANEAALSETVKQYAERTEVMVGGKPEQRLVLPQMVYMFPAVPQKKGDQVKALSSDAKVQNVIFLKLLRRRWVAKRDEVAARAAKLSVAYLEQFLAKEAASTKEPGERPSAADLRRRALQSLGITRLSKFVEEDAEEKEAKAKESLESKRHEAAHAHEAFVRGKKALELWLPTKENAAPPKPPRFVFGTGKAPLRSKQTKVASSTVDMMRTSGLKVVHALSAGKQGRDADLEKSRGQLEREGHVSRRNYADADEYQSARTKTTSGSSLDPGERVRFRAKKSKSWVVATVVTRTRTRFEVSSEDGERRAVGGNELTRRSGGKVGDSARVEAGETFVVEGSNVNVCRDLSSYVLTWGDGEEETVPRDEVKRLSDADQRSAAADESYKEWLEQKRARELARDYLLHIEAPDELKDPTTGALVDEPSALAHWKAVGAALKAIDRTLQDEWLEWSRGFEVTPYVCQVLWDAFQPIGDDVHASTYSLARSALARVLRPGLGYKQAVDRVVQRKWRAAAAKGDDPGDFDEATPEDLATFKQLDRRDLRALLKEVGIELRPDELRCVVDAFDDENRGTMDADRFIEFTGPTGPKDKTDATERLRHRTPPVWETTCPITGLSNAFRVTTAPAAAKDSPGEARVKIISKANGEKRRQVELKERSRRMAILKHFDELPAEAGEYSDDEEGGYSDDEAGTHKIKKCTVSQWLENNGARMKQARRASLRLLMGLSRVRRDEAELQRLLEKGQPPAAPVFYCAGPSDPEVLHRGESLEESLLLCWEAPPASLVAFFSVETSGPRGSREQRENIFTEIFRDPDSARGAFRYQTWVRNLQPGTSYSFRIRAFNGFGPGPYSWEVFTTRPQRPNRPLPVTRSPTSVTLRWAGAEDEVERHVREVEQALEAALPDVLADSKIEKATFLAALNRSADPSTVDFLAKTKTTVGLGGEQLGGAVSLLDAVESSPEAGVLWRDLRAFLSRQGSLGRKAAAPSPTTSQVRYTIEQCVSVTTGQWKQVLTTKFSHAALSGLESGVAHRFRVVAFNANGLESKKSLSAVVTTLLETPPPPRVAPCRPSTEGGACLKLAWDPAAVFGMGLSQREHRKQTIDRILSSWTQEGADDEGPVSAAATFRRMPSYRRTADGSEAISTADLGSLLEEVGVDATDAKRAEITEVVGHGEELSLESFKGWWGSDRLSYELRRSEPLQEPQKDKRRADVLCYRGSSTDGRSALVAGLEPNSAYIFTLRLVTPRSLSAPSRFLEARTPPATLDRPVIIESAPRAVAIKWYPGRNGAHKYVVEARLVEALDWEKDRAVETAQGRLREMGWTKMFEGRDNTARLLVAGGAAAATGEGLLPNSVYHLRVTALNAAGDAGPSSESSLCRTASQHRSAMAAQTILRPANAHEHFTIECRGDVSVGDTIVCTEQLLVGRDGKLAKSSGNVTHRSIRFGDPPQQPRDESVVFVGERTIAARVCKDSHRSAQHARDVGAKASGSRVLRMEVIWSTVSSDEAGAFVLRAGEVIEREESALFEFEVFRTEWKEEARRVPEARERAILGLV